MSLKYLLPNIITLIHNYYNKGSISLPQTKRTLSLPKRQS